jgi:hypothetical protein
VPLYPKAQGSRFLGNVGEHLPDYAASHEKAAIFTVAVVRTANLRYYAPAAEPRLREWGGSPCGGATTPRMSFNFVLITKYDLDDKIK